MSISYPTSIDSLSNPGPTDVMDSPSHSTQHSDKNDAIEALEAKLGIGSSNAADASEGKVPIRTSTAGTTEWSDSPINHSMSRQAIINGNFDVWQRGTSFTPAIADYMADRWRSGYGVDGGTLPTDTVTRQALTTGDISNSFFYIRLNVNGAGSGFGADAYYSYQQPIEFGTRFLCGASKTVTLSFWAKSDITDKKLGFNLWQLYGTGGAPSSAEAISGDNVTLTSSWTKYTHTFTTNTLASKTFGTDNNDHLRIDFSFMWGATRGAYINSSGTAEDFGGSGNIDIAQVQLCAGSVALPFQPKSFAQELSDCERYCQRPNTGSRLRMADYTANVLEFGVIYSTPMRTSPTLYSAGVEATDWQVYTTNISAQTGFALTLGGGNYKGGYLTLTKTSHGLTDGFLNLTNTGIVISAEL